MAKIEELKAAWYELNREMNDLNIKRLSIEDEIAREIAASVGLSIGSIISVKKAAGEARYRVESLKYQSWGNNVAIWGRTIRKDGSDGTRREIYGDWEIVTTPEQMTAG